MEQLKIIPASDTSLLIKKNKASKKTTDKLFFLNLLELIKKEFSDFILDLVPCYSSLLIHYNPLKINHSDFSEKINNLLNKSKNLIISKKAEFKTHFIPVYYGKEVAWDLAEISKKKKLTPLEFSRQHSAKTYDVDALGFLPGFGYLGQLATKLCYPRKDYPRLKIAAGSVAIAGEKCAIYPSVSPGGWNIIGKTYLKLIDWNLPQPNLLQVGERVKFVSITKEEFLANGGQIVFENN